MKFAILTVLLFSQLAFAETAEERVKKNKDVVRNFYLMAFHQRNPAEAMKLYGGPMYKQHNPQAPDGKDNFVFFFQEFFKTNKTATAEIKRMIAEGDYVVVHVHSKMNPKDRGTAAIDIFRLENGKIVEHWDVMQPVPEKSANTNGMF